MNEHITRLQCFARRLRAAKRQRGASIPGHRQHGVVCDLAAQCEDLCVYLGLPAGSASGTAKHLTEAIAGLQLQPQR